jgi:hypothetical protein
MSNEKQPAPTPKPETKPDRIPVRVLRFFHPHPSFGAATSITSDLTHKNRSHYVIEYIPAMRHHRVEFRPIDKKPEISFVQEVHAASWEPMA